LQLIETALSGDDDVAVEPSLIATCAGRVHGVTPYIKASAEEI
jgi:hypothetical protein